MSNELDAATVKWTKARAELEKAQRSYKGNPHSAWHKQKLKTAEQEFNLACIDRQQAREKPSPIDWENMNAHTETH